jgi:SHAQKYF class myb-like DNA-binding protein
MEALEQERRKIQVFERELPLCLELVSQAIEKCKEELCGSKEEYFRESSGQTSSDGPVLEEFIPIKRASSSEKSKSVSDNQSNDSKRSDKLSTKSDWLRSVQLWNQTPDPSIKEESPRKVLVTEVKRNGGGAFHPFKKDKSVTVVAAPPPVAAASSSAENVGNSGGCKGEDKGEQSQRKSRRCWSPELHRRFLQALQQLGGSHVATPKQIRELMKVDGLTNDEVKSHLQKYRLHTRRPSPSIRNNNNNSQAPQFVVVGGIWVPPPEYGSMAKAATEEGTAPSEIYAPKATLAHSAHSQKQSKNELLLVGSNEKDSSHIDQAGLRSNSPSTSSSTHTTTASTAL